MTCSYCGTRNAEGEHRCKRCGRTADDPLMGEFTLMETNGALAAQPVVQSYGPEPQTRNLARAVQRPLFPERSGNVIPIESYSPPPPPVPRQAQPGHRKRASRVAEGQGKLDFLPPALAKPKTLPTTVEAVISSEEQVASATHRALAAGIDGSLVTIGYGLFLAVFALLGGRFELENRTNLLVMGAVLPMLGMLYGLLWALALAETPGMRWTGLRLTTFDGFAPERRERLIRFGGSCLSLITVVGQLWALVDEEGLGWQDHISRTFPTPRRADSQVFHRK